MQLLRINQEHTVNLDQVTRIQTKDGVVQIHFAGGEEARNFIALHGEDAKRFMTFVTQTLADSLAAEIPGIEPGSG